MDKSKSIIEEKMDVAIENGVTSKEISNETISTFVSTSKELQSPISSTLPENNETFDSNLTTNEQNNELLEISSADIELDIQDKDNDEEEIGKTIEDVALNEDINVPLSIPRNVNAPNTLTDLVLDSSEEDEAVSIICIDETKVRPQMNSPERNVSKTHTEINTEHNLIIDQLETPRLTKTKICEKKHQNKHQVSNKNEYIAFKNADVTEKESERNDATIQRAEAETTIYPQSLEDDNRSSISSIVESETYEIIDPKTDDIHIEKESGSRKQPIQENSIFSIATDKKLSLCTNFEDKFPEDTPKSNPVIFGTSTVHSRKKRSISPEYSFSSTQNSFEFIHGEMNEIKSPLVERFSKSDTDKFKKLFNNTYKDSLQADDESCTEEEEEEEYSMANSSFLNSPTISKRTNKVVPKPSILQYQFETDSQLSVFNDDAVGNECVNKPEEKKNHYSLPLKKRRTLSRDSGSLFEQACKGNNNTQPLEHYDYYKNIAYPAKRSMSILQLFDEKVTLLLNSNRNNSTMAIINAPPRQTILTDRRGFNVISQQKNTPPTSTANIYTNIPLQTEMNSFNNDGIKLNTENNTQHPGGNVYQHVNSPNKLNNLEYLLNTENIYNNPYTMYNQNNESANEMNSFDYSLNSNYNHLPHSNSNNNSERNIGQNTATSSRDKNNLNYGVNSHNTGMHNPQGGNICRNVESSFDVNKFNYTQNSNNLPNNIQHNIESSASDMNKFNYSINSGNMANNSQQQRNNIQNVVQSTIDMNKFNCALNSNISSNNNHNNSHRSMVPNLQTSSAERNTFNCSLSSSISAAVHSTQKNMVQNVQHPIELNKFNCSMNSNSIIANSGQRNITQNLETRTCSGINSNDITRGLHRNINQNLNLRDELNNLHTLTPEVAIQNSNSFYPVNEFSNNRIGGHSLHESRRNENNIDVLPLNLNQVSSNENRNCYQSSLNDIQCVDENSKKEKLTTSRNLASMHNCDVGQSSSMQNNSSYPREYITKDKDARKLANEQLIGINLSHYDLKYEHMSNYYHNNQINFAKKRALLQSDDDTGMVFFLQSKHDTTAQQLFPTNVRKHLKQTKRKCEETRGKQRKSKNLLTDRITRSSNRTKSVNYNYKDDGLPESKARKRKSCSVNRKA